MVYTCMTLLYWHIELKMIFPDFYISPRVERVKLKRHRLELSWFPMLWTLHPRCYLVILFNQDWQSLSPLRCINVCYMAGHIWCGMRTGLSGYVRGRIIYGEQPRFSRFAVGQNTISKHEGFKWLSWLNHLLLYTVTYE